MMYHVVYGLLYAFSLLPLRVLYLFSDLAYLVIYYGLKYRRDVVARNLSIAFPEKSEEERYRIAKKFYRNFTDNFIETLKCLSASKRFIRRHFTGDFSIFDRIYAEGKQCQVHMGHNFNWELMDMALGLNMKQIPLVVYMPISSKIMNRVFLKLRARTGNHLIAATRMQREFMPYRHKQYALFLVADQSPVAPDKGWWMEFFGKPTVFVYGPEKNARSNNIPVVFSHILKKRRGYYEVRFELAVEEPASLPPAALTRQYIRFLEEKMRMQPDIWLWSHRRWKWDWKEEYGEIRG